MAVAEDRADGVRDDLLHVRQDEAPHMPPPAGVPVMPTALFVGFGGHDLDVAGS